MFRALILLSIISVSLAGPGGTYTYKISDETSTCDGTTGKKCGPRKWSQISGSSCSKQAQSPIAVPQTQIDPTLLPPIFTELNGGCSQVKVAGANDDVYGIDFGNCKNATLSFNGDSSYQLLQFHFHSPSEHTIGGANFPAEVHMVHSNSAGNLLVVGVLLQTIANIPNNTFLNSLWQANSALAISTLTNYIASPPLTPYSSFLPSKPSFYNYPGSLTTPPCTEGVTWILYDNPVTISSDDLRILRSSVKLNPSTIISEAGNNNRPTQPLNGRTVRYASPSLVVPTMAPTASVPLAVSIAAIVIGCVGLVAAGVAIGIFCIRPSDASKVPDEEPGLDMAPAYA